MPESLKKNGLFSKGMMTRLSGSGRGTGIARGDAEVGERHLSIIRKTIVYTLVAAGLLLFSSFGVIRAQENLAPTASPKTIACIRNGDVVCFSEFLSRGGSAKGVDQRGVPLLVIASEAKSAAVVRLLLNGGADPNDAGSGAAAPICRAADFGRKEIAQTLLEAGAKANVICDGDHGDSALMEAISGAWLSGLPADLKDTAFNPEGLAESADTEVEGNEKIAKLHEVLATSSDDYLEIARLLLARGVDVNVIAKCDMGESALMYAAMAANVEMVKTLLAHGADAKRQSYILDLLRETETECRRAKLTPVPVLSRQQEATINWTDQTKYRREEIARLLKATGAEESPRDEEDVDPKENAKEFAKEAFDDVIRRNDLKDFERLVAAYTKHPLGTEALTNALWVAVVGARVEMVKLLLERGVNPNAPPSAPNFSPLTQAANNANLEIVKLLLDAGADINAHDQDGRTALDDVERYTYSSEAHRRMAAFLKERGGVNGKVRK
jgi:ankyrin repeat protein